MTLSRSSPHAPATSPMTSHHWQYVPDGLTNPIASGANKVSHRLARKPPRRLATVPSHNSSVVQRATPDDFLSFLIDGPLGGLETYERFPPRQVERGEQGHDPGSVHSYAQGLLSPLTSMVQAGRQSTYSPTKFSCKFSISTGQTPWTL